MDEWIIIEKYVHCLQKVFPLKLLYGYFLLKIGTLRDKGISQTKRSLFYVEVGRSAPPPRTQMYKVEERGMTFWRQ